MPLHNYSCPKCNFSKEHMLYANSSKELKCPKCNSDSYNRGVSRFRMNVEYADNSEYLENKVQPHVNEIYSKMGREALSEDTKTAEDIFGTERVEKTITKDDEA